jgi:hypothetical protein
MPAHRKRSKCAKHQRGEESLAAYIPLEDGISDSDLEEEGGNEDREEDEAWVAMQTLYPIFLSPVSHEEVSEISKVSRYMAWGVPTKSPRLNGSDSIRNKVSMWSTLQIPKGVFAEGRRKQEN